MLDLNKFILQSKNYDEEDCKPLLETISADGKKWKEQEKEERK